MYLIFLVKTIVLPSISTNLVPRSATAKGNCKTEWDLSTRLYQHNFTQFVGCRLFFYSGSLNVWFRLTKCRLTRFRRPHIPMISFVCLCVFMWKDGYVWSYGWTATRMGIGNEFANPKFPNCLSRFWYFAELVNCLFVLDLQSNRPHPSLFGSSSACTY